MAHFHTHFSFCLLVLIIFSSPEIEARFGRLYDELPKLPFQSPSPSPIFNEISQPPSGISPSPSPVSEGEISPSPSSVLEWEISPSPSPVFDGEISPSPSPVFEGGISESPVGSEVAPTPAETIDNAYGLYGSSDFSNEVFNHKTTGKTTNNVVDVEDDDVPSNGFNTDSFKELNNFNQNGQYNFPSNNNYFKNGESYNGNNNGIKYDAVPVSKYNHQNVYNNLPSNNNYFKNDRFSQIYNDNGGVTYDAVPASNYNNRGFNDNYNADGFEGKQGISDTRVMENGKYYYDVQNDNNNQKDGYGSVNRDGNNAGGYYGDKTKYEFDSMDEYEREQGYPDDQNSYVP